MSIDTILAIVFGVSTVVLSIIAIRLQIKQYNKDVEDLARVGNFFEIYTTREALKNALQQMYYDAESDDTIWGQCVGCSNYFENLYELLLRKSTEGVKFKVIINSNSDGELEKIFSHIDTAKTKKSKNVKIRLHGLSNKQLILSFKSVSGMAAIKVYDVNLINIIRNDFEMRWNTL
jgi:hypothetical protein